MPQTLTIPQSLTNNSRINPHNLLEIVNSAGWLIIAPIELFSKHL